MAPDTKTLRRHLVDSLVRFPPWQDDDSRPSLAADLAWGLTTAHWGPPLDCPARVAESLVDLALTSGLQGASGRNGALALGLPGLIEDLRELGVGLEGIAGTSQWGLRGDWRASPYPGLFPLEHWQAPIFFGRRAEVRALLRRLVDPTAPQLQLITGPRGCGKSSLLGAGVRGWLAAGNLPRIPAAEHWVVSALFPAGYGGDPFLALAQGLVRALDPMPGAPSFDARAEAAALKAGGAEALSGLCERVLSGRPPEVCWVLAIDQLEELFDVVDPDLADEFLEMLSAANRQRRLRILAVLGAPHFHCACAWPPLIQGLNQGGLFVLGPPTRSCLERMILGPLTLLEPPSRVQIERALVTRLLDDLTGSADALALLADGLRELYGQIEPAGRLTLERYEDRGLGRHRGGLGRRAERAIDRLGDGAAATLGRLFGELVHVGADGTATRRRTDRRRLAQPPETRRLVESLAAPEVGLIRLRAGQPATAELAHEALLHQWPLLGRWIERRAEALRLVSQVERAAALWLAAGRPPEGRWRHETLVPARALLSDAGLIEGLERDLDIADFLTAEPDWLIAELLCAATTPVRREEIGLRLAEIGDPRPGVGVAGDGTPTIEWCSVPPGEVYLEGHGTFQVQALRIAAYPVTQGQLQAFLDAEDGFARPQWWRGLQRVPPLNGRLGRRANYPATQVSWCDAVAFSRWLSARLGLVVRLPAEWEWQWAAQSARPGFVYPWGRDWREGHANTEEGTLGGLTAVGLYPRGRSLQGVYDLAGGIWEWCQNRFDRPRVVLADSGGPRVLKGGSWRVNRGFARADFRLEGLPEERLAGSGFRMVAAV